jgi:hypothetical protein
MIEPARRKHADEGFLGPAGSLDRLLKTSISRRIASVARPLIGPVTTIFVGGENRGCSPGTQNIVPVRSISA